MLAAARTCRRHPSGAGVRVPPVMAAYARQGSDITTSCSGTSVYDVSNHLQCRHLHSSTPANRAALQAPSLRPHTVYAFFGPSLASGRYYSSLRPWRRRLSLWGGPSKSDQQQRPGAEGGGNALQGGPEELAHLEQEVLKTLAGVCEPCTGKGVVALGLVQDLLVRGEELLLYVLSLTSCCCCCLFYYARGTFIRKRQRRFRSDRKQAHLPLLYSCRTDHDL